ncbi:hypothetical protein [Campylobacter geochelonis]|uniref:hypothetical protein n=1 Tax=Campylobacter geochelonis TaxID=1780362 RepID=UPI0007707EF2|nr:hypothetical protein [Campylobacter geochelonis]CZE46635.1 Uncharacterised protein [Campylobacter geochelonis]
MSDVYSHDRTQALKKSKKYLAFYLFTMLAVLLYIVIIGKFGGNNVVYISIILLIIPAIMIVTFLYDTNKFISYYARDEKMYRYNLNPFKFIFIGFIVLLIAGFLPRHISELVLIIALVLGIMLLFVACVYFILFHIRLWKFTNKSIFIIHPIFFIATSLFDDALMKFYPLISISFIVYIIYIITWFKINVPETTQNKLVTEQKEIL